MRQLSAFCLFVLVALIAFTAVNAQEDIEYGPDGTTPINFLYYYRVPLQTSTAAITAVPSECSGITGFIAGPVIPTAWLIVKVPIAEPTQKRQTYAYTAINVVPEACRAQVNQDTTAWVQNFISACKSNVCGGSFPCACKGGATCTNVFSGETLTTPAFCEPGYVCNGTAAENNGTGSCIEAGQNFRIIDYTASFTEPLFYGAARSPACLKSNIQYNYALQSSSQLYFTATSLDEVTQECKDTLTATFGGTYSTVSAECKSTCGAPGCVCEVGNLCSVSSQYGAKQCANKLKCAQAAGSSLATCNNSVIFSATFAVICALIAVFV